MNEQAKPFRIWEWSLYYLGLPLAFIVIFVGVMFAFMGYDLKQSALAVGNNLPFVSSVLADPSEDSRDSDLEKEKVAQLTKQLEQLQADISQSEQQVVQKDQVIDQLTKETQKLKAEVILLKDQLEVKSQSEEERKKKIAELAHLYEKMPSKKAAAILEQLEIDEAGLILQQIADYQKSAILAKVDPSTAAELTLALKELN